MIGQQQVDRDVGVLPHEVRQRRHDVLMPDQHARMHPQDAARNRLKLGDALVRLVDLLQDVLDLGKIDLARLGERQLAAGAVEQAPADAFLQRADVARDRGRRQSMLAPGGRQAAVLHHAHEQAHRAQPFHPGASDLFVLRKDVARPARVFKRFRWWLISR
jgi:hypothetical protein